MLHKARFTKQSRSKSLEIGQFALFRAANVSKLWEFITTKLLPIFKGPFVVNGRKKENCHEFSCPNTGEVIGHYNLRLLIKYNAPLRTEV
ncbi:hypothetical protein PR048_023801 [Dryococelus australis]|uniref:Ribosomal protein S19 n=1 Tax=Dryococelus australis TaxID=614101 RepID=A0ABQ9GV61_9NEOP|nr:hypothetical protein PR048_023801 [Dryococelus australis]